MKAITVIKDELKRIKGISRGHFIFAAGMALVMTCIAVIQLPLDSKKLSFLNWLPLFMISLPLLFFLYASVNNERRSVFWSVRWLYYILVPVILMSITGQIFNKAQTVVYSENYFSRFFPIWILIWLIGTVVLSLLARVLESAARRILAKNSIVSVIARTFAVMYTPQKIISRQKREGKSKWIAVIVCVLMIALAVFILTVTLFLHNVYSNMEFEAILFTVTFAAGGLALEDFIAGCTLTLLFSLVTGYLCYHSFKCFRNDKIVVADTNREGSYTLVLNRKKRIIHIVLSIALLCVSIALFSSQTNFVHYVKVKNKNSDIYANYYVEPDSNVITFPGKKRNLIYIYIESMENTYASKEDGGILDKNYISELTALTKDSDAVSFSNTEKLGGASVYVPAITYTMGSTVAQTSGIVTNTEIFSITGPKEFPAVTRLEDILHDNGYNQVYIEGSNGEFSMYDKYVGRYEDSIIYDRIALAEQGYTDEKADYIWKWGIEDRKLFEVTKELITEMSQQDKPFFVTMYTMDTHSFETGHRCSECDSSISNDYLAAVDCTSRQTADFVNWVRQQPFYENTTIILVGDHLGNEKTTMVEIEDGYVRTTYNCFINPAKKPVNTKKRIFSSLDMFPSTLSAIGVEIKGDRLALGTDLFSGTRTLCEELGVEEYKEQLERDID